MKDRVALLTGSTGGIGEPLAEQLAQQGWDLILLNRSESKTSTQLEALKENYPEQTFHGYIADFLDLDKLKETLASLNAVHSEINALYNNAGFLSGQRSVSVQNIEAHFAVNTVAPYLITKALQDKLAAASTDDLRSVVVNFSSEVITGVKTLDVATLVDPPEIGGLMGAYATSKLAANVYAQARKEELAKAGITILSVDPGPTRTPMIDRGDGMPWFLKLLRPFVFRSAPQQVARLLHAADEALRQQQSGLFISNGKVKADNRLAQDPATQEELLELLEQLIS